jgi:hypothetical protein
MNHDKGMPERRNMIVVQLDIMATLTSMNHDKGMTKSRNMMVPQLAIMATVPSLHW